MISRRLFLGATVAGVVLGLTGIATTRSSASIRFIGRRDTIVTLLDTGTERVLFILGAQDDELLGDVVGLTTIGGSRIDLIVATHRILATRAARTHLGGLSTPTFSIQADSSLPPIRGEISVVTGTTSLELGSSTRIRLVPSMNSGDHPDFVTSIDCCNVRINLVSSGGASRLSDGAGCDLLVVPGRTPVDIVDRNKPKLLVCTAPDSELNGIRQIQVYRSDPQIVRLGDGQLSVRDNQFSS